MTEKDNLEVERAAFEAWYAPIFKGAEPANMPRRSNGEYGWPQDQIAWMTWQAASRAPAVGDDGLPPLPDGSVFCAVTARGEPLFSKGWMFSPIATLQAQAPLYTAEQYRQGQRDAVAADRRAREIQDKPFAYFHKQHGFVLASSWCGTKPPANTIALYAIPESQDDKDAPCGS